MADWFGTDFGQLTRGYVLSLRANLATEIVKQMAIVAGTPNGEDSAGRSKLDVMPSGIVAERAIQIADALVTDFERRGWIRETTMTHEEEARMAGEMSRVKHDAEFKKLSEQLDKLGK